MLTILSRYLGETSPLAFPVLFLGMFLLIGGGALWLTPRLARWLDRKDRENKSYYDGMLEEDPNSPRDTPDAGTEKADKADKAEEEHV